MRHVLLFRDSMGRRVGSGKMRAAFRAGSFLLLLGCYGAAIYFRQGQAEEGFTEADETEEAVASNTAHALGRVCYSQHEGRYYVPQGGTQSPNAKAITDLYGILKLIRCCEPLNRLGGDSASSLAMVASSSAPTSHPVQGWHNVG